MSNTTTELSESTFNRSIANGVTLVDFWAPWCGPCRMQGPILDQVAATMGDRVQIGKLNVDDNPGTAAVYGVMSIPTLIVFKEGKLAKEFVGVQSEGSLVKALEEILK